MSTTAAIDDVRASQARLEINQMMQGEKLDHIVAILLAFRDGETPAEEWEAWLSGKQNERPAA